VEKFKNISFYNHWIILKLIVDLKYIYNVIILHNW